MTTPAPSGIRLQHANIDDAADDLVAAGNTMQSEMESFRDALRKDQANLSGELATAAKNFADHLDALDTVMSGQVTDAANKLREMHGLLRDADRRGAAGVG
ncbi:hypothetical protein J5Y04_25650 [Kitasatospora sp. RG8]|uniref:hypothetical protein n=1 Tax=Kitasatospora sp. RG8 TaxID=2820815 RepID=UPI001ADF418A|nr:hypothetical protein [Kitasatospora sp. RG8]MBP0452903.1 hypothetical protein [Kitasatospora sp. RG8]